MKRLNEEQVSELIELTPKQQKAFDAFKKAVKRCEKENVFFYTVLDTISALNGNNVETVLTDEDGRYRSISGYEFDAYNNLSNKGFSGFADDAHYIVFKSSSIPEGYDTGDKDDEG